MREAIIPIFYRLELPAFEGKVRWAALLRLPDGQHALRFVEPDTGAVEYWDLDHFGRIAEPPSWAYATEVPAAVVAQLDVPGVRMHSPDWLHYERELRAGRRVRLEHWCCDIRLRHDPAEVPAWPWLIEVAAEDEPDNGAWGICEAGPGSMSSDFRTEEGALRFARLCLYRPDLWDAQQVLALADPEGKFVMDLAHIAWSLRECSLRLERLAEDGPCPGCGPETPGVVRYPTLDPCISRVERCERCRRYATDARAAAALAAFAGARAIHGAHWVVSVPPLEPPGGWGAGPSRERHRRRVRASQVVDLAEPAFWTAVAKAYPEARTGDFPPDAVLRLQHALGEAIEIWAARNVYRD